MPWAAIPMSTATCGAASGSVNGGEYRSRMIWRYASTKASQCGISP